MSLSTEATGLEIKEGDFCQNYEAGLKLYRGERIDHGLSNKERD